MGVAEIGYTVSRPGFHFGASQPAWRSTALMLTSHTMPVRYPPLGYYAYKIQNILLTRYATPLGGRTTGPGLVAGTIGAFQPQRRMVLYFADTRLVHLGDQLFHQGLINLLKGTYEIFVAVGKNMAPYYEAQGVTVLPPERYGSISGAVIVSKDDLAHAVSRLFPNGNLFVGANYHLLKDQRCVLLALTATVASMMVKYGMETPGVPDEASPVFQPYVPRDLPSDCVKSIPTIPMTGGGPWIAYNDFVNSNFANADRRRPLLEEIARRKKSEGYRLLYVGSENERLARPQPPDFIDQDIRGATGPLGLYSLLAQPAIQGAITYDTFFMHVASALRKDLYVVIKQATDAEVYRRRYVPFFPGAEGIIKECV